MHQRKLIASRLASPDGLGIHNSMIEFTLPAYWLATRPIVFLCCCNVLVITLDSQGEGLPGCVTVCASCVWSGMFPFVKNLHGFAGALWHGLQGCLNRYSKTTQWRGGRQYTIGQQHISQNKRFLNWLASQILEK